MAAWIIYTSAHDYYALAPNEACRDAFLAEVAVTQHREGYAEPYPEIREPPKQRHFMGKWLDQVAQERAERMAAE